MSDDHRVYNPRECAVFRKTKEEFGGLSNMAGGFPLTVDGISFRTAEALYQCFRFPHRPELQQLIIDQASPMTAKMKTKRYRSESRPDWERVRVDVMRWCLQVKLAHHWNAFGRILESTGDRPIVEHSRRDSFWGATASPGGRLAGTNALGRLLMELREDLKDSTPSPLERIEPLGLTDELLLGEPIVGDLRIPDSARADHKPHGEPTIAAPPVQTSLWTIDQGISTDAAAGNDTSIWRANERGEPR